VYLEESARREKRQVFLAAIGIAVAVMVLAPPIVQAAAQKVNIVKSKPLVVKKVNEPVAVSNGQARQLGAMGAIPNVQGQFPTKAMAVATTAGGGGFWGVGVCGAPTEDSEQLDEPDDNRVIVPASQPGNPPNVVTAVLLGEVVTAAPPALVTVKAPTLPTGNNAITGIENSNEEPTKVVTFGNGLTVSPSRLVFECGPESGPTGATFVVLGQ
jgi:hypothetical protein